MSNSPGYKIQLFMKTFTDSLKTISSSQLSVMLAAIVILALLTFLYPPPFSIQEINALVTSKSVLAGELNNSNFINFAKSSGFFVSPIPILVSMFFKFLLPHSFILAKIPNILILLGVYLLYKKFLLKDIGKASSGLVNPVLVVLLATSPWLIQAAIYNPSSLISLIFFVPSAVYLKRAFFGKASQQRDKRFFFIFLTFLSLSSLAGLIASLIMLFASSIFFLKSKSGKNKSTLLPVLAVLALILGNILINKDSIFSEFNQGSVFTKISLSRLSQDIDERQKIDFLSSNKNFILPPLVRKFTYNKLALATDRIIRKSISLIDFEHLASPNESYDIIKLSGILPKGNLPLYYIWELPLITYGAFRLLRKKGNIKSWYLVVLISSIVPAILFEKKDFPQYAIFIHASLFVLSIYGLTEIEKRLRGYKLFYKIIPVVFIFVVLLNYLNFLNLVFAKKPSYLRPNILQYQQIASWVRGNANKQKEIFVTNRFGPTQFTVPVYLDFSFENYWGNYSQVLMTHQNLTFTSFDLQTQTPKSGVVYIGFPGEFVGTSKNHDASMLPTSYELIDVLKSSDESVYQFGRDLWVVELK